MVIMVTLLWLCLCNLNAIQNTVLLLVTGFCLFISHVFFLNATFIREFFKCRYMQSHAALYTHTAAQTQHQLSAVCPTATVC